MIYLYAVTILLVALSLMKDRGRTLRALRIGGKRFLKVAPAFLSMLVLVAVILGLIPDELMMKILARDSKWIASASAIVLGSVAVMPGFVVFPLCGILLGNGALYMVLSAFSTTLMMVGVATFPLEKVYLGTRLALVRNLAGLIIAVAVAAATGLFFGELL
ncbi:MAG: hypothetical protein K9M45_06475 [Kiritimatiellales bacterium]|nr:hypothetical protein [Kiritimatiellales bacterium]